jgi:glyoxylase-like metal-dependent hydrolase (beta-lactamase superfamily II)
MYKINHTIFLIHSIISNQYIIVEKNGFILIDAGLPGNAKYIRRQMEKNGWDYFSIKKILVTHADGDHYGCAGDIQAETKTEIWAGKIESEAMKKGDSSRKLHPSGFVKYIYLFTSSLIKPKPTLVDHILQAKTTLPIGCSLRVLSTLGHTPGHFSFFIIKERILFCGDAIRIINRKPLPSIGANTWDDKKARESCAMQLALKPRIICAGHGFLEIKND